MTNEELGRLDGNLSAQKKALEEEIAELTSRIDTKKFFSRVTNRTITERSRNRLKAQRDKLRQMSQAIQDLQSAISVSDPTKRASVEAQKAAYERLVNLENEINFEGTKTPLRVSTEKVRSSLRNTLQTIYNKRLGASYGRIALTSGIAIGGLFLLPAVANVLGLAALSAAASPIIWGAIGVAAVRGATHLVHSFIRKRNAKKQKTTYEALYPTLANVKGFANTLGYFRGLRRSVGKRFDAMTDNELFNKLSTSGFAPVEAAPEDARDREHGKDDAKSYEATIAALIAKVAALDVNNKADVYIVSKEFDTIYAAVKAAADVEIKNKDLLELCNLYLDLVKLAHEGKIDETKLGEFLAYEGKSENFKDIKDSLVIRLEALLESVFKDTLSTSVREMFEKYKHEPKKDGDPTKRDRPDPEDLDEEEKKKKGGDGRDDGGPRGPEPEITPEKAKEEIDEILNKMARSTSSADFTELLKQLNELIKKSSSTGIEATLDDETKIMLTMLRSYMNFSEAIRSGIYNNLEFYGNLRNFLNPENEVGSERVREFRSILIRQLNSLVRDELKINDSRLTGLIDYGFAQRSSGSFGKSEAQRTLIRNISQFDFRNFSPENVALARNILDEVREIERLNVPENEFHLDHAATDTLANIEMFSSVCRDRDRLSAQIKACQAIMKNPSGYSDEAQRSTIEECVRTYYHLVGFVNHVLSNEYSNYSYTDRNGNSQTRGFDESGIGAAIDLKLVNSSQITALRRIMEFYKATDLRLDTDMSRQGQYMDEQLSGYRARR